jgi:hypothetical protein
MDLKKLHSQFWLLEGIEQHLLHSIENAHVSLVVMPTMHVSPQPMAHHVPPSMICPKEGS